LLILELTVGIEWQQFKILAAIFVTFLLLEPVLLLLLLFIASLERFVTIIHGIVGEVLVLNRVSKVRRSWSLTGNVGGGLMRVDGVDRVFMRETIGFRQMCVW